jgi:hypothetical protein
MPYSDAEAAHREQLLCEAMIEMLPQPILECV